MTCHASVIVTAEHSAPIYPTEAAALAATGNKHGSGYGPKWAVWLVQGGHAEIVGMKFSDLSNANEYAKGLAEEIAALAGQDAAGVSRQKVVRLN